MVVRGDLRLPRRSSRRTPLLHCPLALIYRSITPRQGAAQERGHGFVGRRTRPRWVWCPVVAHLLAEARAPARRTIAKDELLHVVPVGQLLRALFFSGTSPFGRRADRLGCSSPGGVQEGANGLSWMSQPWRPANAGTPTPPPAGFSAGSGRFLSFDSTALVSESMTSAASSTGLSAAGAAKGADTLRQLSTPLSPPCDGFSAVADAVLPLFCLPSPVLAASITDGVYSMGSVPLARA